jgi:translation initiation factor 2D
MDEYINEAFMNALKMSVTDKDLPLDSSVFYQNHMLLAKNSNVNIDLKNSSYKKIGKFL